MSNFATETMLQAVDIVKENAKNAEREFDMRASALQRKAGRSIDLLGGRAVDTVADIASESRKICDSLYSTYQTLIKMLDDQCRPLLDQDPEPSAVRKVRDMIKWLNDESEIQNNFTASLNSRSLGGVASARYIPTIENKMIQSFWETKYQMLPGRLEAEQAERQSRLLADAEKRRAKEEELKRRNEEEKQRFERESAEYNKKREAWEKSTSAVQKTRSDKIKQAIDEERAHRKADIENRYSESVRRIAEEKKKCGKTKAEAENRLSSLGFFSFGEKKKEKKTIAEMTSALLSLDAAMEEAERTYNQEKSTVEAWVCAKRAAIVERIEKEHPLPIKPTAPAPLNLMTQQQLSAQLSNLAVYDAICAYMEPGHLYTLTDLQENIPELFDMTLQRVSALVRQMLGTRLKRVEDARKAYFGLID